MNQLQAMRVFAKVVDTGAFWRAAEQLGMSNAVVTRHVAMLETHLNVRLLHRNTRNLSLTEAGEVYLQTCRTILDQIDDVEARMSRSVPEPFGTLKVAAPTALALTVLTPVIADYRRQYPRVKLRISMIERHVDLSEEGYDAALVMPGMCAGSEVVQKEVLRSPTVAVASPEYLADYGHPAQPEDLGLHSLIGLVADAGTSSLTFADGDGVRRTVATAPNYLVNSLTLARESVLAGIGIAMLPRALVAEDLWRGSLHAVLPRFHLVGRPLEVLVVYPRCHYLPLKTRQFVELVAEQMQRLDAEEEPEPAPALSNSIAAVA